MKIQQNNSFKLNFGYDKKLNQELITELSNCEDRKWAETLLDLNSTCNNLENTISLLAKDKKLNSWKFQDYLDIFTGFKNTLVAFVSTTCENLNYADREFLHYLNRAKKSSGKKNSWQYKVCESIRGWVSPQVYDTSTSLSVTQISSRPESELSVPKLDNDSSEIKDDKKTNNNLDVNSTQPSQDKKVIPQLGQRSLLEKFEPDASSPKGFIDVAGMDTLKRDLNEGIIELINNPEQAQLDFEDYGKTIPKGVLLYGPPGCGKTYITQALASEIDTPMYLLNISKAGSHYINMTAKNIKAAFDEAISIASKTEKPCVIFMDEIDSLAFDRSSRMEPEDLKQVATMLQSMDEAKKANVLLIGATNKYNLLDPAIRRRFNSKIFVDVPDDNARKALIIKNLTPLRKAKKLLESESDIELVVKQLKGYSSDSICKISKSAALNAMHRNRSDIELQDYEKAIKETTEEKPDRKLYQADSLKNDKHIGF